MNKVLRKCNRSLRRALIFCVFYHLALESVRKSVGVLVPLEKELYFEGEHLVEANLTKIK